MVGCCCCPFFSSSLLRRLLLLLVPCFASFLFLSKTTHTAHGVCRVCAGGFLSVCVGGKGEGYARQLGTCCWERKKGWVGGWVGEMDGQEMLRWGKTPRRGMFGVWVRESCRRERVGVLDTVSLLLAKAAEVEGKDLDLSLFPSRKEMEGT